MTLGLLTLAGAGWAVKDWVVEEWYLRKLESEDQQDRADAARTLGEMGSVRAISPLTNLFLKEPNEGPHLPYSAEALVKIGEPSVAALSEALQTRTLRKRREVIWTIGAIGAKAASATPYRPGASHLSMFFSTRFVGSLQLFAKFFLTIRFRLLSLVKITRCQ